MNGSLCTLVGISFGVQGRRKLGGVVIFPIAEPEENAVLRTSLISASSVNKLSKKARAGCCFYKGVLCASVVP